MIDSHTSTGSDDLLAFLRVGRKIRPIDQEWVVRARSHLDSLTKPLGSLGVLEDIAARVVAIQESSSPCVAKKATFVFAADHGITSEGVSAYPKAVTEQMVLNFLQGGAAINVLARAAGAKVHIVDVGIDAHLHCDGLISQKVAFGTKSFRYGAAMSIDELYAALKVGCNLANEAHVNGTRLVAVGEMGIGNTTAASAITAAMTGESAERVTGKGTGVMETAFQQKKQVIREALELHFPGYIQQPPDSLDILRCVGGLEIAAMCGFILSAAQHRIGVVVDGFISTAAAAIACRIQPATCDYLFGGHLSQEPGHQLLLNLIGLTPLLKLNMRLGEGTGAVLAFNVIDAAVRTYNEMATFSSAGVSGVANR